MRFPESLIKSLRHKALIRFVFRYAGRTILYLFIYSPDPISKRVHPTGPAPALCRCSGASPDADRREIVTAADKSHLILGTFEYLYSE